MGNNIKILVNECLQCKNPTCIEGCPAHNNIPLFIKLCKEEKYQEALNVIKQTSTLPSICSLVCPSENQCQGHCIKNKINKPVQVSKIEQFITLNSIETNNEIINNGHNVAIIGSGPASLACAEKLRVLGYKVDVYDKYHTPGGILTYGIPEFVLDKKIVNKKIDYLKSIDVNFIMNKEYNKDISLEYLCSNYDAIFLGFGASIGKKMEAKNNNIKGIVDANEFLLNMYEKNDKHYINCKNILVIGGGNTAIDAARVAKRKLNSNVTIVYRRSENEMPARKVEISKAKEDGINFYFLANPIAYHGEKSVFDVECIKMRLEKVDGDRARPVVIENSNFIIKADLVIEAISSSIDSSLTNDLATHSWGGIVVNENQQTSIDKVFAGGDCSQGPSLVVKAMKDGIKAAESIDKFIKK